MTAAFLVGEEAPVSELAVDLELTNTAGLLVVPLGANRYAVKAVGGFSASWGAHWQVNLNLLHCLLPATYGKWWFIICEQIGVQC